MQSGQLKLVHLVITLCLSVFAFSINSTASQKDGLLKVYFLDVGQGDAIFIETPNGNQILIDGGPDSKVIQELAKVMSFYDKEIDLVVASHPHADHIAGLIEVLKRYDVNNILEAKDLYDSPQFNEWHQAVTSEHTNQIEAIAWKIINLGEDVDLIILYPLKSYDGITLKKPHEANVIAMLRYKNFRILLTGDAEASAEKEMINNGQDIDADVLKVGHHGSKTSTTTNFLEKVSPEVAFIQVGAKNRYGHPTAEVLSRLEKSGIKYYRNDLDGTIKLMSDGKSYKIEKN